MREIKFRAWDGKRMLYPGDDFRTNYLEIWYKDGLIFSISLKSKDWPIYRYYWFESNSDAHTLMQYTGLNDNNGTPIYEGDIIKEDNTFYQVYWNDNYLAWHKISKDRDEFGSYKGPLQSGNGYSKSKKRIVIGNIYQNPNLIVINL